MEHQLTKWGKVTSFYHQCRRVFKLTRKPSNFELKTIVKVCAMGMALLGSIGFAFTMVNQLLFS